MCQRDKLAILSVSPQHPSKHVCADSVAYVDALDCVVRDQYGDEVETLLYYDINISFVTDVVMR